MYKETHKEEDAVKDAIYSLTLRAYVLRREAIGLREALHKERVRADHNKHQLYKAKLAVDDARNLIARLDAKTTLATTPRKTLPAATIKKLVDEIQAKLHVAYLEASANS